MLGKSLHDKRLVADISLQAVYSYSNVTQRPLPISGYRSLVFCLSLAHESNLFHLGAGHKNVPTNGRSLGA